MLKKVQIGAETTSYTSLVSRAIPAMPVSGESFTLHLNSPRMTGNEAGLTQFYDRLKIRLIL